MKKVLVLMIVLIATATATTIVYFRMTAIPVRAEQSIGWYFGKDPAGGQTNDSEILRLALRARIDQFVNPIPGTHRLVALGDARENSKNEIYLVFYDSLGDHSAVIYCGSRKDQSLKWKAVDYNSP